MAQRICILILLFLFSFKTQAQSISKVQAETHTTITGMFDALGELDLNKVKTFCTGDVTMLESGQVWNMDSLAARITARKARSTNFKRVNKLKFIETKTSGDIAWVSYFNEATISSDDKIQHVKWLESAVLRRENGSWKICLLHSTEMERTH